MLHVTVQMDEKTGNVSLNTSPQLAGSRIGIYGLLQMGMELCHRLGDPKKSEIVIPTLDIIKH
jgi:hypothetical protein